MGEVVAQVRRLADNGYREVVLTGVDLTSYGADLAGTPKLGTLVRQILRHVGALERLRLSSLDCIEIDDELLAAFAEEPRLMPHLHLSLQSGDDLILKRMKRRHSARGERWRSPRRCAACGPDIVFGADIIAGFPTETEAMFSGSLALVEDCGLTHLHVFPYSPRPGTPAARMPQVARDVAKDRARRLREAGAAALSRRLDGEVGQPPPRPHRDRRQWSNRAFHPGAIRGAGRTGPHRGGRGDRARREPADRCPLNAWRPPFRLARPRSGAGRFSPK